jgi:hypothetical protein
MSRSAQSTIDACTLKMHNLHLACIKTLGLAKHTAASTWVSRPCNGRSRHSQLAQLQNTTTAPFTHVLEASVAAS